MVLPSEASGGDHGSPELTSNKDDKKNDKSHEEIRTKRQYYAPRRRLAYPRYRAVPMPYYPRRHHFFPRYPPYAHYAHPVVQAFGVPEDPSKPRVKVHIETEKKDFISHQITQDESLRKKRQLLGLTSLMSPVQPIKSPLQFHNSVLGDDENAKSEVPKERVVREEQIEVPIRAEEQHGIEKARTEVMNDVETKKSTIQRIQKREASNKENHEDEHTAIRKRQFVFNSEPPVVRGTVKGESHVANVHSPIGNLIKLIAGKNSKSILGLNSKSFDVFPGPLPDAKESSVWNIKSAEEGRAQPENTLMGGQVAQAYNQQQGYNQQLEMEELSQRRAEAAKNAEKEAEAEKEAINARETEAVMAQTQAQLQERKLEEEKALEKQHEVEQEQQLEQERADEMAKLMDNQARQRSVDMSQPFAAADGVHQPVAALAAADNVHQPVAAFATDGNVHQPMAVAVPAFAAVNDDSERRLVHFDAAQRREFAADDDAQQYPMQPVDFQPTQMLMPPAAMAYRDDDQIPDIPFARPTPAAFFPSPTMMFMPTAGFIPSPRFIPTGFMPDGPYMPTPALMPIPDDSDEAIPEHIHRPVVARVSDGAEQPQAHAYQPHYPTHYPTPYPVHHQARIHVPTKSPYHYDDSLAPYADDDDEKPEVHVHIQTEKSQIPQGEKGKVKDAKSKENKVKS